MSTDQVQTGTPLLYRLSLAARTISVIFHPIFVGIGMMYYITFVHPDIFLGVEQRTRVLKFITFANNNGLFPLLIVWLLKGLGFSRSIRMDTARERIIPYISVIIFQFWTWHVFRNQSDSPGVLTALCLGIFLSASLALVANTFMKVSMHAIGMGGLTGLMVALTLLGYSTDGFEVLASMVLAGLVGSARMVEGAHSRSEMLMGFCIGFGTQYAVQMA
ncbi:MAG: hypothetical protein FJX89_06450 [Bacteroidetes bacterium]|nr:hypothetical protein [Bacteroidota bacterium]